MTTPPLLSKTFNPINSLTEISFASKDLRPRFSFKLILAGESSVGKTSLISAITNKEFLTRYTPTICFEYIWMNLLIHDSVIRLQIWDTCGQEIYQSLIKNFYHNASIAFLVFSLNDRNSFDKMDNWFKEIKEIRGDDLFLFLIGNKADLKQNELISSDEIQTFIKTHNIKYYGETSAKTGKGVDVVFKEAAKVVYNELIVGSENDWEKLSSCCSGVIDLSQPKKDNKACKDCLCCAQ